ncbi:hypothetical protein [Streptomyces sp. NPDC058579]|uniref:hypothetical protein n=1 Tax=Streptomyces sp. NPDC058579 TaxID=3346548 RepID=UPI00364A9816
MTAVAERPLGATGSTLDAEDATLLRTLATFSRADGVLLRIRGDKDEFPSATSAAKRRSPRRRTRMRSASATRASWRAGCCAWALG